MKYLSLLGICCILFLGFFVIHFLNLSYGQSTSGPSPLVTKPPGGNNAVSVSATLTIEISNETLKTKDGMLRYSVVGFLNSGPNVLKTSNADEVVVKTKISNRINNDTQNVEGAEATTAIIGVEIGKALKTLVSSSDRPNQTAIVTVQTSSVCKPSTGSTLMCDNVVNIK